MANTTHSIRMDDKLWERFGDACAANHTNRTEKINQFAHSYVHRHEMRTGYLTEEASEAIQYEIQRAVKKYSVDLLQRILHAVGKGSITEEEIVDMMDVEDGDLREYL